MDQDYKDCQKGFEVAEQIVRIMKGDPAEDAAVKEWADNNESATHVMETLGNPDVLTQLAENFRKPQKEESATTLMSMIRKRRVLRRRKLGIAGISAVAVAVATVLILVQPLSDNQPKPNSGVKIPTLILGSGAKIEMPKNALVTEHPIVAIADPTQSAVSNKIEINRLVIPRKYTFMIQLADGTKVHLNADSELAYKSDFNESHRSVELVRGEAFFEVAHSSEPFTVTIGASRIKVYGTRFNVNYYDRQSLEATLIEGAVGISFNGGNETRLKPSQKVIVNPGGQMTVEEITTNAETAWLDGYVWCDEQPLGVLLDQIKRHYDVVFEFSDKLDTSAKINAVFNFKETKIEDVIKSVETLLDVEFKKESEGVYSVK